MVLAERAPKWMTNGKAHLHYFMLHALLLVLRRSVADAAAKFEQAKATSTQGPEFDAAQALQPGSAYWCSAGQHPDDEQVSWSATLEAPTLLRGLRVAWAYSPELVQVSVSADGRNWVVASPFKRTPSNDVAFNEDIFFDHPHTVQAVMITMRKCLHDYFGISEVSLLETGEPAMMIVAGITSKDSEMCLQVEGGTYNKEGAHVVLDACSRAIAAGDGREIWVHNINKQLVSMRSAPKKCITLQDGISEGGGQVVLTDCLSALEEGDGRSSWTVEPNSQLRLQKSGFYCMTQKSMHGNEPGAGDIAGAFGASAICDTSAGGGHEPAMTLDRDVNTFWASGSFPDAEEHLVVFELDLGKSARLAGLRIDWEYPALAYKVQVSENGKDYNDIVETQANPSNVTLDALPGPPAQHVRILMTHPHTANGKVGEGFVYGIREVYVLASRLDTAVSDCKEAANTDDARDKYFLIPIHEFDAEVAAKMESLDTDVSSRSRTLSRKTKDLTSSMSRATTCVAEKANFSKRLESQREASLSLREKLITLTASKNAGDMPRLGYLPGDSVNTPAEDCFEAKASDPEASSGFYWILPPCAPQPLRVFCDMLTSTSMYFWRNDRGISGQMSKVHSVPSLRLRCAEKGLEPLVLSSPAQLRALRVALEQLGIKDVENAVVPLAQDMGCLESKCTGTYQDLYSGTTDLTSLLLDEGRTANPDPAVSLTAGISLPGGHMTYFNLETAEIAAVVCSTNAVQGQTALPHVDIGCDAVAAQHPAFFGITNTNVVVECPPGCGEASKPFVFGTNGIYSDLSSICRAAIHAGALKSGGIISVSLENSLPAYKGSLSNGIVSEPLNTPNTIELRNELKGEAVEGLPSKRRGRVSRSIRLVPVAKDCPIESLSSIATSFLDLQSLGRLESNAVKTPNEKAEDVLIDPAVAALINEVLQVMDEVHGLDPSSVFGAQSSAADAVAALEEELKPAEALQKKTFKETGELLLQAEGGAATLLNVSGSLSNKLDDLITQLEKVERQRQSQIGFESFALNYTRASFNDTFETHDTLRTAAGPSSWGYAEVPLEGRRVTIGQSSPIRGKGPAEGTFAILKSHRFFDGVLHADFNAFGKGTVGIAFRTRDPQNTFLLSFNAEEESIKLIRVEDGEASVVAKAEEGSPAYREAAWQRVRVELHHGHIKVAVSEEKGVWKPIIDAFDERFVSGTIGLFVSGVVRGVFFDALRLDASKCSPISTSHPQSSATEAARFSSLSRRDRPLIGYRHTQKKQRAGSQPARGPRKTTSNAEASAPWNKCCTAVHPLERQRECQLVTPAEGGASFMSRCVGDFCRRCCTNATTLLGTIQKQMCLLRCKAKESQAAELQVHLNNMFQECADLEGEGFSHCKREDTSCIQEACGFCCESRDAESELHAELLEKARKNRPQEVRECQRHCQSVTAANAIRVDA